MFLLSSMMCAVAFSFLGIIYGTGEIPFVEKPVESGTTTVVDKEPSVASVLASKNDEVDQLRDELLKEKMLYQKKITDVAAREEAIRHQLSMLEKVKKELGDLQSTLTDTIIKAEDDEQVNLKRLAAMYAKMDSGNASSLLGEMEPERAARIVRLIPDRQAAGILSATVGQGASGTRTAAEWSDIIRRMEKAQ